MANVALDRTPAGDAPNVTSELSAFAAGLRYNAIPPDVRTLARLFVLDYFGVTLGAADFLKRMGHDELFRYVEATAPAGVCTFFGNGQRTTAAQAAFANGTLGEVLDFGDSQMDVITHNSTPIIPAAVAVGEQIDATWGQLATAIVAGYEVHNRLAATVQTGHWYRGFQAHGTFGTCGAAVAVAKLRGFDARRTRQAMALAGCIMPVSASDNVFKAYSVKACIPGQAASCGVTAADLAAAGYDGVALEGEPPRFHAPLQTLSDGQPRLALALAGLGSQWNSRRVSFKPYPVGHLIVGPVEIVLEMTRADDFDWREIDRIDIATFGHAVFRTGKYASPDSSYIDAHFSIPYCVAVALIDGALTPRQLWTDRVRDPRVHELASRIVLREDAAMSAAYPARWPVEIEVRLRNGRVVKRRIDEVKWSPERPPGFDDIADKFRTCAAHLLGDARTERAISTVAEIRRGDPIRPLLAAMVAKRRRASTRR